jgi:hypothetical protein
MSTTALIRPAWTPATIALTVVGFMVFWPLGLAMLAFILWGDRLPAFRRDWDGNAAPWAAPWASWSKRAGCGARRSYRGGFNRTGNVAFDDWREKELERLAEERRKLDGMRDEFDAYARELRRAKDQEEFDRFMANRTAPSSPQQDAGRPSNDDDLLKG